MSKDFSLRELQVMLPWSVRYSNDFRSNPQSHKDFAHAIIHIVKATGKLAALIDDMDHDRAIADQPGLREDHEKFLADLVVCALRAANVFPGGVIDLHAATVNRIEAKNGVELPHSGGDLAVKNVITLNPDPILTGMSDAAKFIAGGILGKPHAEQSKPLLKDVRVSHPEHFRVTLRRDGYASIVEKARRYDEGRQACQVDETCGFPLHLEYSTSLNVPPHDHVALRSDQMECLDCGLKWDANDPHPPQECRVRDAMAYLYQYGNDFPFNGTPKTAEVTSEPKTLEQIARWVFERAHIEGGVYHLSNDDIEAAGALCADWFANTPFVSSGAEPIGQLERQVARILGYEEITPRIVADVLIQWCVKNPLN